MNQKLNYRHQSREHLQSAKDELSANSDHRLKFAALELRMAMECLTYDRALGFKDEFPPSEYDTWQPRKMLAVLLEIDPLADQDSTLAVGVEAAPGVPAASMQSLGSEKVLNMRMLKSHYDALGSYLHVPSLKQSRDGPPLDFKKLRARCEAIATFVEQVLASPIFNITLGNFAGLVCMECGKPMRKRLPHGEKEVKAECFQCDASYTIIVEGDGKVFWKPHQQEVGCANPNCQEKIFIWNRELKVGREWECNGCHGRNILGLGVIYVEDAKQDGRSSSAPGGASA
ncbi:MAG: hypothetical protein JWN40_1574 [Phycisphaerales bacterium]|nr:hypothetical protein [Phycisphaerales bacterium]